MSSKLLVAGGLTLAVVAGTSFLVYRKVKKNKKRRGGVKPPVQLINQESLVFFQIDKTDDSSRNSPNESNQLTALRIGIELESNITME